MKICFFGDYDPNYNRIRVILKGLNRIGVSYVEVRSDKRGPALFFDLVRKYRSIGPHDVVVVAYGGNRLLPILARLISTRPVVWDPLYSLYDNWVYDRKLTRPHSVKAYYYWFIDWLGCMVSNKIFLDTVTDATYFERTFHVPKRKLGCVYVGADDEVFQFAPFIEKKEKFEVEFHGKYIPVQGVDVLVRAAKILENDPVHFTIIGSGQESANVQRLASELGVQNVDFLPYLSQAEIVSYIERCDVSIGLIGDVPRVVRAIPNKMYEASAMGRATISVDSTSIRELYEIGKSAVGVERGSATAVAQAIRDMISRGNAKELGEHAYNVYKSRATPEIVARQLLLFLEQ